MARGQSNTNGVTPLADTGTGAAGTVTGTERSNLQGLVSGTVGAAKLATGTTDGDKLHNVGANVVAYGTDGASLPAGGGTATLATLTLPSGGTWLCFAVASTTIAGEVQLTNGGTTVFSASYVAPSNSATAGPVVLAGGGTIGVRFSSTAGTTGVAYHSEVLAVRIT